MSQSEKISLSTKMHFSLALDPRLLCAGILRRELRAATAHPPYMPNSMPSHYFSGLVVINFVTFIRRDCLPYNIDLIQLST